MKTEWNLNTFVSVNENKLPGFGRLLESWLNVHRKFCASLVPEHSWEPDYRERPQIGFLSNAAVLIGGLALEEWGAEKKSDAGDKRSGRNDLWLRLGSPAFEKDYYIEAKYNSLQLLGPFDALDQVITGTMDSAIECARQLDPKNNEKIVAISFLTLRYDQNGTESLDNKIEALLLHLQEQKTRTSNRNAIGAIWLGREDFEASRNDRNQYENNSPGIILLANRVA